MSFSLPGEQLEQQDRDQLLRTVRRLLVEADALSSRIAAVNEIGIAINRTLDLEAIQRVVARQAKWLLDFEHCSVCLAPNDGPADAWKVTTLFGPPEPDTLSLLESENVGPVLSSSQPRLILTGCPSPFLSAYASQMIVPLIADDVMMGTINFATRQPRAYTQDDMRIGYMLALQLSSAIRNARTFEELRRTRDELHTRAAELEARNQELDAYSHTIAHDLKSPLSSIILKSELTAVRYADSLPPPVIEALQMLKTSGLKMNEMIDQLLWLAKLRNVREAAVPLLVDGLVKAAVSRFLPVIEQRGVQIDIMPEMPAALGQAQWVEEVFANLISNAIKYSGENNAAPRICIRGKQVESGMIRYEVQDNGVGISPENQKRLFTMFTRLHTTQAEGVGLGLSIVLRIVSKLGGQVGVESQPGVGSTFWFTLPAAPPE
jgi:signal transduction histidine kinase